MKPLQKKSQLWKKELENGDDSISNAIENDNDDNNKTCTNGHLNVNVRKNRKYCTVCKGLLIETENFDTQEEEDDLELDTLPHKRLNLDHSKNMNVNFSEMKPKEKSDLYENVRSDRNLYSKNLTET